MGKTWLIILLGLGTGVGCGKTRPGTAPDGGGSGGASADGGADAAPATDTGGNDDGATCTDGGCPCPAYQSLCGGRCIPTSNDPGNCGGCGVACAGTSVCAAGACVASCPAGLTACAQSCVDVASDNKNCGGCGTTCDAGKGCVKGHCADAIVVGTPPAGRCAGGGPPITNDPTQGGCLGGMAQTTFRWGLCSCKDVHVSDKLLVDAYDSRRGPYQPGGLGGGVGANGIYGTSGTSAVWGALWCAASDGITTTAANTVKQQLRVGGKLHSSDTFGVGDDAFVAGDVTTSSAITIGKTLHVPVAAMVGGGVTATTVAREPVTVAPPCDCQPAQIVPVAAIVAAHAGTSNDNASIGLDAAVLASGAGARRLDLPCGSYYLSGIDSSDAITIAAHGRTALYIDGDVHNSDALAFALDPGAEFDIFIAGTITSTDKLTIGSPNYPAMSRTYVGSAQGLHLTAGTRIGGNIYAAAGKITWTAAADVYGSLFAGDFDATASTAIHYDRAVLNTGSNCPVPGLDGGVPGCGSCKDCGNQACIGGMCGACGTSADCCAPLVCMAGKCVADAVVP